MTDLSNASTAWRKASEVIGHWPGATALGKEALRAQARDDWWSLLDSLGITLLLTREYEHFVLGLSVCNGQPHATTLPLPHPSGLVVDRSTHRVFVAATRNPNQIMELRPCSSLYDRADRPQQALANRPLMPYRSTFYPGSFYLHDLALIDGQLYGNTVGHNAVTHFSDCGAAKRVWWPRSIEQNGQPDHSRNHLQLNSIAAGPQLSESFFSASTGHILPQKPGDMDFPVDGTGVIFSGKTREVICDGLTRPHSARLHKGQVWVDNSGYGQLGLVQDGSFTPVVNLPGWTRGLAFCEGYAFVGTSRVLPRFHHYAPGLDPAQCVCSVQAIDLARGESVASICWEGGNQIFAIDWLPRTISDGLAFPIHNEQPEIPEEESLFYAYRL